MMTMAYPRLGRLHSGGIFLICLLWSHLALCDEPVLSWQFDAKHVDGNVFRPTMGKLTAHAHMPPRFRERTGALELDGTGQWCVAGVNREARITASSLPASSLSVAAWVYIDRLKDWDSLVSAIQDNGEFERGWMLGIRNQSFCFGLTSTSAKKLTYLDAAEPIEPGNWYHIAATYDGKAMKLYIDGRLQANSTSQSGPIFYPPTTVLALGAYRDDDETHPLKGALASLAIYDSAEPGEFWKAQYLAQRGIYEQEFPATEAISAWPTYMRDNRRSGRTPETLRFPLTAEWIYQAHLPPRPAWPEPANQDFWHRKANLRARVIYDRAFHLVSDGKAVFFGSSADGQVVSLDIRSGRLNWRFITGGPVRLAPTVNGATLLVGSDDGHLYCLHTSDGTLRWRFRAAPSDRVLPGNQRLISAWPVRTGAFLDGGLLRIAAGLFPNQGTYQYSLDPSTGEVKAAGQLNFSPQGYMQRRGTQLMVASGRAPPAAMGALSRAPKPTPLDRPNQEEKTVYAGITAGPLHVLAVDDELVAIDRSGETIWSTQIEGHCYSLAVADGRLLASTDSGHIYCFSAAGTQRTTKHSESLSSQPGWDSLPVDVTAEMGGQLHAQLTRTQGFVPTAGYALVASETPLLIAELLYRTTPFELAVLGTADEMQALRELCRSAGLSDRVTVFAKDQTLPFVDNLFNLIVVGDRETTVPPSEFKRALRPAGGLALIGHAGIDVDALAQAWQGGDTRFDTWRPENLGPWIALSKKPADGIGRWDHIYGSASNTACSDDKLLQGPLALQWFGGPGPRKMIDRHHRTIPPLVSHGRLFIPGDNRVICVDAYNGAVAWETEIPGSRRVGALRDAGSMTVTEDLLYVAAGDRCWAISVATGERVADFTAPELPSGAHDWGYVAHKGQRLIGTTTRPGASRSGLSREQISETYFDFVPIVTSDSVFSSDRHNGRHQWQYVASEGAIINPTITMSSGHLFFIESANRATLEDPDGRATLKELLANGAWLVAIDLQTSSLAWKEKVQLENIQHHLYLAYTKGSLLAIGSRNAANKGKSSVWFDVHSFDAGTGKLRWSASQDQRLNIGGEHGEQDRHPTIVGDTLYVEPYAYSVSTGKRLDSWHLAREGGGCGSISASAHTFFFRAGTPTMCNLETGLKSKVTSISRPGCWINMIPAEGMLLVPEASSGCTCDYAIQTSMGFAPLRVGQALIPPPSR